MAHYHHTVTCFATPSREFTKRCRWGEMSSMDKKANDIQEKRREILRTYIDKVFETSVNAFAGKLGRKASFFSELLNGKRPFRESLAEKLEEELKKKGLPAVNLRQPPMHESQPAVLLQFPRPWPFDFERERYDHLTERQKGIIEGRLLAAIELYEAEAEKVAVRRSKKSVD